jgi:dCMP deaminase
MHKFTDITLDELFVEGRVIRDSTGCAAWTMRKNRGWAYGLVTLISPQGNKKVYNAHRLALHLTGRMEYESKQHALHNCDKRWCVEPSHLRPGTNRDNALDRYVRSQGRVTRRPTSDETWFHVAQIVATRSECVRRQAGCVITGTDRRIIGSGVNGKPDGLNVSGPCSGYCHRALTGGSLSYSDCTFIHAEMNALMFSDRTQREGGTAYVTSCPCFTCAQALSNSGVKRVVCAVGKEDRNRQPEKSIDLMMKSGIIVEIMYRPKVDI